MNKTAETTGSNLPALVQKPALNSRCSQDFSPDTLSITPSLAATKKKTGHILIKTLRSVSS